MELKTGSMIIFSLAAGVLVVKLALLSLGLGYPSPVRVVGADHDWTVHVGDGYYGLVGFEAKVIPGLRIPAETSLHFGTHALSFHLHIYWVIVITLGLLGMAAAVCAIVWRLLKYATENE